MSSSRTDKVTTLLRAQLPSLQQTRTATLNWYGKAKKLISSALAYISFPENLGMKQKVLLYRRQLNGLSVGGSYFLAALIVCSWIVWSIGQRRHFPGFPSVDPVTVWATALLLLAIPHIWLFRTTTSLDDTSTVDELEVVRRQWCVWLTLIALVWVSGNWTLQRQTGYPTPDFWQQTFIYNTILGQIFVVLCLSSSLTAVFSVTVLGFLVPFEVFIAKQLKSNPQLTELNLHIYFSGNLIIICLIGCFVAVFRKHIYLNQILLEHERQRAEMERKRANNFITTIGHDLNQPLTALALQLENLKAKVRDNPEALLAVRTSIQLSQALGEMMNAAFDLSRLDSGAWTVKIREVALPHLIERIVGEFRAIAADHNLKLETSDIPSYVIRTDPDALARVLRNLVGNAIKYTPAVTSDGPGRVRIECLLRRENEICISVIDNGVGIPNNRIKDIFKEYIQIDNPERDRAKGFGLGLSIVKGLVDLLGHKLEVNSAEDRGSQFSIAVEAPAAIPAELLPGGRDDVAIDLGGMSVVLVEDDRKSREALAEYLIDHGCFVIEGESASDAIAALRSDWPACGPHFILSDYRLRESKTGIQAIKEIRTEIGMILPSAILTADTAPTVLKEIMNEGLELIGKPIDLRLLSDILSRHKPEDVNSIQQA
jgi:signal transduction histidine kinase/ActR/RegA family two-component response regulator